MKVVESGREFCDLEERPRSLRWAEAFLASAAGPTSRRWSLRLARAALWARRFIPGRVVLRGLLRFIRMEAACCERDSPHFKFLQRYVDEFERCGFFDRMLRFFREAPVPLAARRLDAWARMYALATLRHELLRPHAGRHGVPPRLLAEAQLALSPACDLACEGCYSVDDRGGKAPRRDDIAFLVDEVIGCGAFAVHLIGKGEPLLSPAWAGELLDVIEARPHALFTLATHGMHLTDALAERLGSLANVVVFVAVDGPEPLHDARRGEGSYRRVRAALASLRRHGAMFGYSCMVSAKSRAAVASREFVKAQEDAGCALGVYSRYFPLASDHVDALALDGPGLDAWRADFARARDAAQIPLLDLDEMEQHTGCHSRAGESVYIDGPRGRVAPCLRVPFAPDECRVDRREGLRLADVLAHPFFQGYRDGAAACPTWCGANLDGELRAVERLLDRHATSPARLYEYQDRARSTRPVRRLPIYPGATSK